MAQTSRGSGRGRAKAAKDAKPRAAAKKTTRKPPAKKAVKAPAKRRGKSIEKIAADTIPQGPRLTALERFMQASYIGVRRTQRATWPQIASEVGLGQRQCQVLMKQIADLDFSHTLSRSPTDLIEWLLVEYERDLMAYTLAAAGAVTEAGRVGALNGRGKALERITSLLQATGRMPRNLGVMRHIHDLQLVAKQMNVLMVGIQQGEIEQAQVTAFFARLTGQSELPPVKPEEIVELREGLAVRDAA